MNVCINFAKRIKFWALWVKLEEKQWSSDDAGAQVEDTVSEVVVANCFFDHIMEISVAMIFFLLSFGSNSFLEDFFKLI